MKLSLLLGSAGAVLLATSANAAPNLLTNGSFEAPGGGPRRDAIGCNGACPGQASVAGADIPGWNYNGVGFAIYESSGVDGIAASDGSYYISLGHSGAQGEAFSQSVGTTAGVSYTLTYDVGQQQSVAGFQDIVASITSVGGLNLAVDNTNINGNADGFAPGQSISFTGDGSLVTVTLLDLVNAGGANTAIDNVALVAGARAVPEPASWAMMLAGFGLVGAARCASVRWAGASFWAAPQGKPSLHRETD